jgi:cell cycle arrest protein BUB3
LVASWDRNVYLYDTSGGEQGRLLNKIEHRAPVLDICFGHNDKTAFSAGLDWDVNRIDLESGQKTLISSHNAGVKSIVYSHNHSLLVSASWDSTLHVHILKDGIIDHAPATIPLPSKPFSISLTPTRLVVAMASRQIYIYELAALKMLTSQSAPSSENAGQSIIEIQPWQQRESSLKFMTRAVCCMPNDQGYALSSIEGRVGVEWFDPSTESQSRKYAFKCHRQAAENVDVVYPVNALAFHPVHQGTFVSGGGDGFVVLWDGVAKRRIRQYQAYPSSVASVSWSSDGRYLAVAISPGFEDGNESVSDGLVKLYVRELAEGEAKGKSAK